MTEEKRQIFLETFQALDMPIIWKWDTEVLSQRRERLRGEMVRL
jgi:hypothetical protein